MRLMGIIDQVSIPTLYRIAFLTNFAREPLLRRMQREFGIIRPEWTVLICLRHREDVSPSDICEFTEQPRNTVSRAVASLEERRLIRRESDQADGRRARLSLTQAGKRLHDRIMPMFEDIEAKLLEPLNPSEREAFAATLQKLCLHVPMWIADGDGEAAAGPPPDEQSISAAAPGPVAPARPAPARPRRSRRGD